MERHDRSLTHAARRAVRAERLYTERNHMTGQLVGMLQWVDERRDGQLRDPLQPLRQINGGIVVPKQLIRELKLRPGLIIGGQYKGRTMGRVQTIEGKSVDDYLSMATLYESTALDPQPVM